jgi:hypothetical protein
VTRVSYDAPETSEKTQFDNPTFLGARRSSASKTSPRAADQKLRRTRDLTVFCHGRFRVSQKEIFVRDDGFCNGFSHGGPEKLSSENLPGERYK